MRARVSTRFRFIGGSGQWPAWQRSTFDPYRDLASGKVILSCSVASFGLLVIKVISRTSGPHLLLAASTT
jgi:hypothetical protein